MGKFFVGCKSQTQAVLDHNYIVISFKIDVQFVLLLQLTQCCDQTDKFKAHVMHTMDNNYIPISSVLLDYGMNNIKMNRSCVTHVSRPVFSLYKRSVGITTQNVTRWCPATNGSVDEIVH